MLYDLPDGIFKTLIDLWNMFQGTFSKMFEFFGETAFGSDGSVLVVLFESGLGVVLTYWIVKFFIP